MGNTYNIPITSFLLEINPFVLKVVTHTQLLLVLNAVMAEND